MGIAIHVEDEPTTTIPCPHCTSNEACWPGCSGTLEVPNHHEMSISYSTLSAMLYTIGMSKAYMEEYHQDSYCEFTVEAMPEIATKIERALLILPELPCPRSELFGVLPMGIKLRMYLEPMLDVVRYAISEGRRIYWA